MSSTEQLTARQERDLLIATEAGDADASRTLVEAYLPAIAALARGFQTGMGVGRQELVQEGVAGLLFAARRFDARLNTPFWAYASFWVRKAMQELVAELATERRPRGVEEPLSADGQTPTTLGDTIVDPVAEQAYEHVLDTIEIREVRDLAEQLDERERAVIRAHYGLGEPTQTLNQIGGALGLTAERARQVEAAALDRLREACVHAAPAGGGAT